MEEDEDDGFSDFRKTEGLPIFRKGEEIYDLVHQICELIPEDNEHLKYVKAQMLGDAALLTVKIAGAEAGGRAEQRERGDDPAEHGAEPGVAEDGGGGGRPEEGRADLVREPRGPAVLEPPLADLLAQHQVHLVVFRQRQVAHHGTRTVGRWACPVNKTKCVVRV